MTQQTYNGCKNKETWNVTLWLQNDEGFYRIVRQFSILCENHGRKLTYPLLIPILQTCGEATPDGVKWDDTKIDILAVNDVISSIAS